MTPMLGRDSTSIARKIRGLGWEAKTAGNVALAAKLMHLAIEVEEMESR